MKHYFNPVDLGFYIDDRTEEQIESGTNSSVPETALEIEYSRYLELLDGNSQGKPIIAGEGGYPELAEYPKPTPEEIKIASTAEYNRLFAYASNMVNTLIDATDPDIMGDDIDPGDMARLKLWKKYRVDLTRVDLTNPVWPVKPK